MRQRSPLMLVRDIKRAMGKMRRYTHGLTREGFSNDEKGEDAVLRNLAVIGEAARAIPDDVKARFPEVEWRRMVGVRILSGKLSLGIFLKPNHW